MSDADAGTIVGIRPPNQKGPLLDVLADRRRFSEDILRTMDGSFDNNAKVPNAQTMCLVTDDGHPFTSVKYRSINEGRVINKVTATGETTWDSPILAFPMAFRPPEITSTPAFSSASLPSNISAPSVLERNARLNPVFAEMLPTKAISQIGETVVSLLRGEFPSILRNLSKLARNFSTYSNLAKEAPKYVGGEYLNAVFGWTPLIRDFENAIKVLTTVDALMYGTAYRRHRIIEWDTKFVQDTNLNTFSTPYGPDGTVSSSIADAWLPTRSLTMSYDIRLSARLVPIARPTIGANEFINQAPEKLQQLGVWYPALGWDLLPYSWLVDWFTSLGSSITNAMSYGTEPGKVNIDYCWATSCTTVLAEGGFAKKGWQTAGLNTRIAYGHPKAISIAKTRFSATPYGFGLDLSSLSGSQLTILAALGLVKRR
jgi:hypothetical protein